MYDVIFLSHVGGTVPLTLVEEEEKREQILQTKWIR